MPDMALSLFLPGSPIIALSAREDGCADAATRLEPRVREKWPGAREPRRAAIRSNPIRREDCPVGELEPITQTAGPQMACLISAPAAAMIPIREAVTVPVQKPFAQSSA